MGYKEEIFSRAEAQFPDINRMIAWLDGFERPKKVTGYTRAGVEVRDELRVLREEIEDKEERRLEVEAQREFKELEEERKEKQRIAYTERKVAEQIAIQEEEEAQAFIEKRIKAEEKREATKKQAREVSDSGEGVYPYF